MKNLIQKNLFFLFTLMLFSCYEPTEGCLEINASNFDVEADEPCDDCCNLPNLTINIFNRLTDADTTQPFLLKTNYQLPSHSDQYFQVNRIFYYLSDIKLITTDGDSVTSIDTSEVAILEAPGDTQKVQIINDVGYFERGVSDSRNLGRFRPAGTYNKIQFNFGLEGDNLNVLPQKTASSHPLGFNSDSTNWSQNSGYIFCKIDLVKDTSKTDEITVIEITDSDVQFIEFDTDFELQTGFDTDVNLRINFLDWFKDIDLKKDSIETIRNKIITEINGSISLESLEQ